MKKMITFYSDSHKKIYEEYFLHSFNLYLNKNFELFCKKIEQISPTGEWASKNFNVVMLEKIRWIIENINVQEENKDLVYADCDIQFFKEIDETSEDFDIRFQKDYFDNNVCAGFFICKQNEKVKKFFMDVFDELSMSINCGSNIDDQEVINRFLRSNYSINWDFLPSEKYWTVGNSTHGRVWNGENFQCNKEVIMHHANFTIGLENKIKLMDLVKEKILST